MHPSSKSFIIIIIITINITSRSNILFPVVVSHTSSHNFLFGNSNNPADDGEFFVVCFVSLKSKSLFNHESAAPAVVLEDFCAEKEKKTKSLMIVLIRVKAGTGDDDVNCSSEIERQKKDWK